jgi:ankyrin repeat protein
VKILLQHGTYADLSCLDKDGNSPLHEAARNGCSNIVKVLLQHGAHADFKDRNGNSCLHLAASYGHPNVLETLIRHDRALLKVVNPSNGYYPLHSAAEALQVECAGKLIEYGAVVTQLTEGESNTSVTVFHLAAKEHASQKLDVRPGLFFKGIQELLKKKTHEMLDLLMAQLPPETQIDVVVKSELGSLLHYFAVVDYAAGIRWLVAAPNNHPPDLENKNGETPYALAVQSNSFAAILQLLDYDVKIEYPSALQHFSSIWLTNNHTLDVARVIAKLVDKGR